MKPLSLARLTLGALLVLAGALWVGALIASSGSTPPALLVYGEPLARHGSTWPVRVVAVWPSERRTALLGGSVVGDGVRVPLQRGVARVPLPREGSEVAVTVEGKAEGAEAALTVDVRLASKWPEGRALRYVPWTREIAATGALSSSGPPLYPLSGRVPAALPTEILVLHDEGPEVHSLEPNAAATVMEDGRALRTERSGVVVHAPTAARPGDDIDVELAFAFDPPLLHLELLVNGFVRDVRVLGGDERSRARFTLPDDVPSGWFAVRASPSPLPSIPSAHAIGLLLAEGDPRDPAVVLGQVATQPGLREGSDPLLRHLLERSPESMAPVRALLGRLRLDDARVPNLAPPAREQASVVEEERALAVERFRLPFRLTGGLFALLAALVALVSARASGRWQEVADDEGGDTNAGETVVAGAFPGGRGLPSLGWALLAFGASLSALWVLDWVIGLTLKGTSG